MSIGWWGIRDPWNAEVAIDEFGPGTLDGNPADGGSTDACGPASIENTCANFEKRLPNYSNIGHIRADMISNGEWTAGATVSNPHTGGCFISNIAWEVPRRGYKVEVLHDYQDAVLTETDVRVALAYAHPSIWIVTNASALIFNESGVHGHFVVIGTYSGDNADGTSGKLYILNSDISGQHGAASGQWTPMSTFLAAQPHGYVVVEPPAPPAVPDIPGASLDINTAIKSLDDALVKLHPGG